MMRLGRCCAFAGLLVGVFLAWPAAAHPLAPSLLDVREREGGRVDVVWKMSLLQPRGSNLQPEFPSHCTPLSEPTAERGDSSVTFRWSEDCGARGIVGESLRVVGLERTRTDVLVHIELRDGRRLRRVISGADAAFEVSERQSRWQVAFDYGRLGVDHILSGLDHLTFVLGLMLLVRNRRALLFTLTAFTLGHSVTLTAAALGYVDFPTRLVEFAIAVSIFVLAVELSAGREGDATHRRPWGFAFVFGLLHGLGFAGALAEIGLPADEIPLALLTFNLGIEVGQIAFVAVVWGLLVVMGRRAEAAPAWLRALPVYAIGSLAAMWCIERAVAWLR
ncbi:MAG: HupE/UreJ family protein [Deltaproteobacteria bacterium]|nr:HupE/UreJ family protein [Deltaproteobacteria bacterium]MBW2399925.1 HupE/UreJ family protein [Deltaproteobacteria bacterium]MBW2665585.1 HupE/UreJ family protein [Deltaproteobacteria bacterium]